MIDTRPVSELREAEDNPRTISEEALERLVKSLEVDPDMLEARPLIVDAGTGEVVGGNMRLRAARQLGFEDVPVYVKQFTDANERREWQMRDNAAYGEWVPDELARLIALHRDEGGDLELLGFSDSETEGYLALLSDDDYAGGDGGDGHGEPDEAPEAPAEPITRPGDLIELGAHRLLCGDAGEPGVLEALVGDGIEFVQALITDPPYGIDLDTDYSSMEGYGKGKTYRPVAGDTMPELANVLPSVLAFFDDVPEHFLFGADYYAWLLEEAGGRPGSWLVWDKRSETSDAGFGSGFELIASRKRHQRLILRHLWFGMFGSEEARNRLHPTQKPTSLMRDIIERWVKDEGAVVDPFAGSGSTLIACEMLRRPCWAVELDPAYCDVVVQRWQEFTGQTARRPPRDE